MNRFLTVIMSLALTACGTLQNRADPSHLDLAARPADSGIVIISTGAPKRCISTSTFLNIMPLVASEDARGAVLAVDSYIVKSDFADHHGFISAITLPAGKYKIVPSIANPYVQGIKIPQAHFFVSAGEIVYLGELFMPVACSLSNYLVFTDKRDRDLAIAISKNPQLRGLDVVTRVPNFLRP